MKILQIQTPAGFQLYLGNCFRTIFIPSICWSTSIPLNTPLTRRAGGSCGPTGAQFSLPVSTISQWWVVRRSSSAAVILASPNTLGRSSRRVGLAISSVREYVAHSHDVWVETPNAGSVTMTCREPAKLVEASGRALSHARSRQREGRRRAHGTRKAQGDSGISSLCG
jgi:hypothetical protein